MPSRLKCYSKRTGIRFHFGEDGAIDTLFDGFTAKAPDVLSLCPRPRAGKKKKQILFSRPRVLNGRCDRKWSLLHGRMSCPSHDRVGGGGPTNRHDENLPDVDTRPLHRRNQTAATKPSGMMVNEFSRISRARIGFSWVAATRHHDKLGPARDQIAKSNRQKVASVTFPFRCWHGG